MYSADLMLPFPISLEYVPYLWQCSDVLILLIDLDNYDTFSTEYLNRIEVEALEKLQTGYFKKRYIVSRTILKHVLHIITNERRISEISTYKDGYGRVCVQNHNELYICISYTESIAALAISKAEVGIDIELVRMLALKSNLKNLRIKPSLGGEPLSETDLLRIWTLKEAYAKFSNKNLHLIFNRELDLSSVSHSTYVLDNKYILSVISSLDSHSISINRLRKIECNRD